MTEKQTSSADLLPCPFCGQQDAFVERLDSDASVVICQGRISEHDACLARGPVAVQDDEDEQQPGYAGAIREWNKRALLAAYVEYITQPGESLAGIACRQLKAASRWVEIRDINAHAFPDMASHDYYPVGTRIKLPA